MEGVLQDLAGVGSGVSLGLVARWAVVARKDFFKKRNRGSRREAGNHHQLPIACRERLRHCDRTRQRFSTSWSWVALRGLVGVCEYGNTV